MPHPVPSYGSSSKSLQLNLRRFGRICLVLLAIYFFTWLVFTILNPNGPDVLKRRESELWAATSHSWLDRISCRHLGICGGSNWLFSTWVFHPNPKPIYDQEPHRHNEDWIDHSIDPDGWDESERKLRQIPSYVFQHAPLIYLHNEEKWWPSDVADFLHHVKHGSKSRMSRKNSSLHDWDLLVHPGDGLERSFLQSSEDPELLPGWLTNSQNAPSEWYNHCQSQVSDYYRSSSSLLSIFGQSAHSSKSNLASTDQHQCLQQDHQRHLQSQLRRPGASEFPIFHLTKGGKSQAPAFLITVSKGNETLDAFWFFFYAFNRGAKVTGIQYGNHIGDWEHVLIRFVAGKPQSAFLSAHEWGSAYHFDALETLETAPGRPIVYAGLGSHAHYATPGKHAYALPFGLLADQCKSGRLWDPSANLFSYIHRPAAKGYPKEPSFLASMHNPQARSSWLEFKGRWGDPRYPLNDRYGRNYRFAGEYKYLDGPTGPWNKALNRADVCEHAEKSCIIRNQRDGYVGPIKAFKGSHRLV